MADEKKIDYGNVKITKLPAGVAFGADDLTKWAHNRAVGASGSSSPKTKSVVLRCKYCKKEMQVIVSKYDKENRRFRCRHCGKSGWPKVIKSKARENLKDA